MSSKAHFVYYAFSVGYSLLVKNILKGEYELSVRENCIKEVQKFVAVGRKIIF